MAKNTWSGRLVLAILWPETEESCQENRRKAETKGTQSVLKDKRRLLITGRRGKVYAETLAVSSMEVNVENSRARPFFFSRDH